MKYTQDRGRSSDLCIELEIEHLQLDPNGHLANKVRSMSVRSALSQRFALFPTDKNPFTSLRLATCPYQVGLLRRLSAFTYHKKSASMPDALSIFNS